MKPNSYTIETFELLSILFYFFYQKWLEQHEKFNKVQKKKLITFAYPALPEAMKCRERRRYCSSKVSVGRHGTGA